MINLLLSIICSVTLSTEPPQYDFKSTSTIETGVPRRALVYDGEDEEEHEEDPLNPGYDPVDPMTPIDDAEVLLMFLTIYTIIFIIKRKKHAKTVDENTTTL